MQNENKIRKTMFHKMQQKVTVTQTTFIFECPILFSDCTEIRGSQTPLSLKCLNSVTIKRGVP